MFCDGLKAKGYRSGPVTRDAQKKHSSLRPYAELPEDEIEGLARMEHERWKQEKLNGGWRYAPTTDKARMLHRDLVPWDRLSPDDEDKYRALARGIPRIMAKARYLLQKSSHHRWEANSIAFVRETGAGDEIRTRDSLLGKQALYR